ncbi:DUF3450 family protein [Sulfuriroseicoccus oceanibius]|uniref:DUF3450 family protein n=1 Tax=Sulfuriroseicoccus oceanibius TaxID=2707525 RepID=A0A6B3L7F6_9BACT|nr:DUF3450 family protein [Sulfuriroseicoccus oceanibius]QQL46321.1 DUF3450 family protein [Sulfuriroseicoccus oceanibius]
MRVLLTTLGALGVWAGVAVAEPAPSGNEPARELVRQWVETERLISREAADWEEARERMTRLLGLHAVELERLGEFLSQAGASADGYLQEKDRLSDELSGLRVDRDALARKLESLRPRMVALGQRLPQPLQEELESALEQVEALDAVEETQGLLQSMASVVTAAAKFDQSITVANEVHAIGGVDRQVEVMYLGLARAFFVSGDGKVAGVAVPAAEGWQFVERDGLGAQVRRAIEITRDEGRPELVSLPVGVEN